MFVAPRGTIQGVRAKFDSRRVFRKKQYISKKKADIFENQKVLIISAPRRQIATTVAPLASTKACWRFLELVEITIALPLLKTSGYHLSTVAQLSSSAVYGTTDTSFHHARHLIMRRLVIGKDWGLDV